MLSSELQLTHAGFATQDREADVSIRFGAVPASLDNCTRRGAAFEAAKVQVLITVPNVGRFLVQDGREIVVSPASDTCDAELEVFLVHSVFAALLHQRGSLPLSASCVQVGDVGVAFVGSSATGKSTLVAHLQQRGFQVIADDLSAISIAPELGAVVTPGVPRLRLWADTVEHLQLNAAEWNPARPGLLRYDVPTPRSPIGLLPLKRIYLLRETRGTETESIAPVTEISDRFAALVNCTKGHGQMEGLNRQAAHLKMCSELLSSASMFELWRAWDLQRLPQTIDRLVDHLSTMKIEQSSLVQRHAA